MFCFGIVSPRKSSGIKKRSSRFSSIGVFVRLWNYEPQGFDFDSSRYKPLLRTNDLRTEAPQAKKTSKLIAKHQGVTIRKLNSWSVLFRFLTFCCLRFVPKSLTYWIPTIPLKILGPSDFRISGVGPSDLETPPTPLPPPWIRIYTLWKKKSEGPNPYGSELFGRFGVVHGYGATLQF